MKQIRICKLVLPFVRVVGYKVLVDGVDHGWTHAKVTLLVLRRQIEQELQVETQWDRLKN